MVNSITARLWAKARGVSAWFRSPPGQRVTRWVGIGLSLIILIILVRAIRSVGWREVINVLPANPLFWIFLVISYLSLPFFNWIINRHWWPLSWKSLAIFQRARVMNESLFSYSGDTYFLVWITGVLGIRYDPKAPPPRILGRDVGGGQDPRTNPFAAIKDSAILSGLAGNSFTLAMLMLAIAMGGQTLIQAIDSDTLVRSMQAFGLLILLSLSIVMFRGRVLSLPSTENWRVLFLHIARVITGHVFIVASWAVALPHVPLKMWILLGAIRLVIGRIPVPNKEVLFGALAATLAGSASVEVAALMAVQGPLHLICHGIFYTMAAGIEASGGLVRKTGQAAPALAAKPAPAVAPAADGK